VKVGRLAIQSLRTLWQQRLRSALSITGILCSAAAIVAMLAVGEGARRQTIAQIEALGVENIIVQAVEGEGKSGSARRAGMEDVQWLRAALPAVGVAAVMQPASGMEEGLRIFGVDPAYFGMMGLEAAEGRVITPLESSARSLVCLLGDEAIPGQRVRGEGLMIGADVYEPIGRLRARQAAVGAIATLEYNRAIFVPATALESGGAALTHIIIRAPGQSAVGGLAESTRRLLGARLGGLESVEVIVPVELLRQVEQSTRTFNAVLGAIAAISLVVGGIGIMNVMLASVAERTREIGLRRAVGAARPHIAAQFLVESSTLAGAGGIAGIIAGCALGSTVGASTELPMAVSWWAAGLALGLSVLTGVAAGVYPACRAAGVEPAVALRGE
jgi:putative ABC transport system permease protein